MNLAGPENNYHYNRELQSRANELRKNMTKAEACLWKYVLRAGGMEGYTFRRQRPILNYVVDFVCLPLLLVIEVDGFSHSFEEAGPYDSKRTKDLKSIGFIVIRFSNEEVLTNIESVRACICGWVLELENNQEQG